MIERSVGAYCMVDAIRDRGSGSLIGQTHPSLEEQSTLGRRFPSQKRTPCVAAQSSFNLAKTYLV